MNYSNPMSKPQLQKLIMMAFYVLKLFTIKSFFGSPYIHLNTPSLQAEFSNKTAAVSRCLNSLGLSISAPLVHCVLIP